MYPVERTEPIDKATNFSLECHKNRRSHFEQQMKRSASFTRLIDNQPTSILSVTRQIKYLLTLFSPFFWRNKPKNSGHCLFSLFVMVFAFCEVRWYLLARRTVVEYVRSLENPMRAVWLAGTLGPHEPDSLHSKRPAREEVVTAKRPQLNAVLHPFRERNGRRKFFSRLIVFFFSFLKLLLSWLLRGSVKKENKNNYE